jgi:hypothetical protein
MYSFITPDMQRYLIHFNGFGFSRPKAILLSKKSKQNLNTVNPNPHCSIAITKATASG